MSTLFFFFVFAHMGPAAAKTTDDAWGVAVKPRNPAEIITIFDENKDGKIDQIEYSVRIVIFFTKLDKNRDDFLTPGEVPGMSNTAFNEVDKNNDGKLSTYEFVTADSLKFSALDANGDGFISADEIRSYLEKRS
jgi:Ca2+-binding EF-hand superfamily protein